MKRTEASLEELAEQVEALRCPWGDPGSDPDYLSSADTDALLRLIRAEQQHRAGTGRFIWRNGRILPESEAAVSIYDSAMMYGDSVFEMTRTFGKKHFRLRDHIHRLFASAEAAGCPLADTPNAISRACEELTKANEGAFREDDEIRMLITASRGPLPIYGHLEPKPWIMICQYPLRWVLGGKSACYDGVRAALHFTQPYWPRVKHHCRMEFRHAEDSHPGAWPILVNDRTWEVMESTGANIVAVRNGELFSPAEDCLPGISLRFVEDIRPVTFTGLVPQALLSADEVFFTCTPFCMVPCIEIDGRPIGKGKPGPITLGIMERWSERVGCDFVAQARVWDSQER